MGRLLYGWSTPYLVHLYAMPGPSGCYGKLPVVEIAERWRTSNKPKFCAVSSFTLVLFVKDRFTNFFWENVNQVAIRWGNHKWHFLFLFFDAELGFSGSRPGHRRLCFLFFAQISSQLKIKCHFRWILNPEITLSGQTIFHPLNWRWRKSTSCWRNSGSSKSQPRNAVMSQYDAATSHRCWHGVMLDLSVAWICVYC